MAFLDAVIIVIIFFFVIYVVIPALDKATKLESTKETENVGEVEEAVNTALDVKQKAEEVVSEAKKKTEDLLHKAEDLYKKL